MAARFALDDDDDVVLGPPGDYSDDPSEGLRNQQDDVGSGGASPRGGAAGAGVKGDERAEPTRKRVAKPRPKLTMDLLQERHGLNSVFNQFPSLFRAGFKGKGHEVADLQRLLEMYSRWHQRLFAHCSFDEFIAKVEKFSSTNIIKNEMRELRQKLILLLDDEEQPGTDQDRDQQQDQGLGDTGYAPSSLAATLAGPSTGAAAHSRSMAASAAPARRLPTFGDDDDDELVAMQADVHWEAAEEVLDDLEFMGHHPAAAAGTARPAAGAPPIRGHSQAQAQAHGLPMHDIPLEELEFDMGLDQDDLDDILGGLGSQPLPGSAERSARQGSDVAGESQDDQALDINDVLQQEALAMFGELASP